MHHGMATRDRVHILEELTTQELDLLIIGGGITGAGILLDAQTRGIRAAVVDMQDFAGGTSSRSTKLVHGGLRYLKQLHIGLVAEVGKERAIVYENGPHVTTPEWMLLPIIAGGTYGKLASSFGIRLYDYLAGVKRSERRKMLNVEETLRREPLLRREGLKGAGYYVEYRTDDARLTLEVMKAGVSWGGRAVNYAKVEQLTYGERGRVDGASVRDLITGKVHRIRALKVVNAAGPWVDEIRDLDGSRQGKTLHHTKGVHIVVDGKRFPLRNPVYFDVPDGRMVFAIPRDGKAYIGTTDTNYKGDLSTPRMSREDLAYLVKAANFMFPSAELEVGDVESSWAGIRPLIHEEGKDPSEISRKDEVFVSRSGLISIAGGKLTGYRKMADKVVTLVAESLSKETGRQYPPCSTAKTPVSGGDVGGSANFRKFVEEMTEVGVSCGLSKSCARDLVRRYGSNVRRVFDIIREDESAESVHGLPKEVYGELVYALEEEMAVKPEDFLTRRISSTLFDIEEAESVKQAVVDFMAKWLSWDEETKEAHRAEYEERLTEATQPV